MMKMKLLNCTSPFFTLVMLGCSHEFDDSSETHSLLKYPKLETYNVHCPRGGVSDSAKIVRDSALKQLPQSQFVPPLKSLLITSKMECRFGFFHNGLDFAGLTGTPIFSIADGTVTFSGKRRLTGNTVVIFHPTTGLESTYGHASENLVAKGEVVSVGQSIQLLGNTGKSTGPHLHLSISYQGSFVQPCALLGCRP